MRNVDTQTLKQIETCILCGKRGFFCQSSMGRCGASCPCCGERHFLDWGSSSNYRKNIKYDETDDMRNLFLYCSKCGIIFQLGCIHFTRGAYDLDEDITNSHFIKKWKNKETGLEYEGMPHFDNPDDWFNNANKVEVLEMNCFNKNIQCVKTHFKVLCNFV